MSRCPDQVVSLEARPPVFKSPRNLTVLVYRPTGVGMKAELTLCSPEIEPGPGVEARYATNRPLGFILQQATAQNIHY
ncbi:hypothetical protein TNCV_3025611 [Trichonephila clavipes]|nr:hypothetical protein TNCV_3025611 [Trichonephila clavipes]